MKIFNSDVLRKNERFINAIIYGSLATILLTIAYILITMVLPVSFNILYIAYGYCIGQVILKKGRGVTLRFSVLAAILTFIGILIGDVIVLFDINIIDLITNPSFALEIINIWLSILLDFKNNILSLIFRVGAIYYAFISSRVV